MQTILVDAINTFVLKGEGIFSEMFTILEGYPNRKIILTGADDSQIQKNGEAKRLQKGCDLLMANPIDRPGQGFDENSNGGFLLGPNGVAKDVPVTSKLSLAHQLLDEIRAMQANIS